MRTCAESSGSTPACCADKGNPARYPQGAGRFAIPAIRTGTNEGQRVTTLTTRTDGLPTQEGDIHRAQQGKWGRLL